MKTSQIKIRLGLATVGVLLLGLIALQVLTTPTQREPISNGIRLSEWLHGRNRATFDLNRPDTRLLIQGFGREAIPLLIEAYRRPPSPRASLYQKKRPALSPAQMKIRALTGLVALSQEFPDEVDPFLRSLLSTPERSRAIPFLGRLGPRYFDAVTNIIATGNLRDMQLAVEQLNEFGGRGRAGIPVVVDRTMKEWSTGSGALDLLRLLDDLRPLPPETIHTLLDGLGNTNGQVALRCAIALRGIPHAKLPAADALREMARTNHLGSPAATIAIENLGRFGIPDDEVRRLALANLDVLLKAKLGLNEIHRIQSSSVFLIRSRSPVAHDFIRKRVIPVLRRQADPAHAPNAMHAEFAKTSLHQVEETLGKYGPLNRR